MDSSSKRLGEVNRCFYVRYRRCVLYLLNDKPSQAVADQDKRPLSFLLCVSDKELAGAGLAGLAGMKTVCASTYTCVLPVLEQHLQQLLPALAQARVHLPVSPVRSVAVRRDPRVAERGREKVPRPHHLRRGAASMIVWRSSLLPEQPAERLDSCLLLRLLLSALDRDLPDPGVERMRAESLHGHYAFARSAGPACGPSGSSRAYSTSWGASGVGAPDQKVSPLALVSPCAVGMFTFVCRRSALCSSLVQVRWARQNVRAS